MTDGLNVRELWNNIMHYKEFDSMPVMHWGCWPETREQWIKEGMPKNISECEYLNASSTDTGWLSVEIGLFPAFEEETIEETDEYRIFRQSDGVIAQHWKNKSCIPHYIDFTLKSDGSGWEEYRKRLQPDPLRIPSDLNEQIAKAEISGTIISVNAGSMVGWIRDWMGVEGLAYLAYDNRELLKEIVNTIATLVIWGLEQILPKIKVDAGWGWEDICFRSGPLISPDIFKEVAVPGYRKIADKLLEYGIDIYAVDCDGMIDHLIPHWLDGGVNVMFPVEIGAWETDPQVFRKKYGRKLRFFGGINKLEIAKGRGAIDAEIARRIPLMKEGGFVPLPDHLIQPGTSLKNYKYYLERIREIKL